MWKAEELLKIIAGFRIMMRVITALILREIITRYGRDNLGFLWTFLEPAMFTIGVTILWNILNFNKHGFPITAFVLVGYSSGLLWRHTIGYSFNAISANQALLYHSVVKPIDLVISRFILEFLSVTAAFVFLCIVYIALGLINPPYDLFYIIIGWFLMAWFGLGLGLLFAALSILFEVVGHFIQAFTYIFWALSGSLYAAEWLPPNIREYALFIPTLTNAELIRYGMFGDIFTPYYNIVYSVVFNLVLTVLGLYLLRVAHYRLEVD